MVGVIAHIANPTVGENVELAEAAEAAEATWIGLADAFWWRDVWLQLAVVAGATSRIEIGPAMTNPYLRHPFHTASAVATLQELAPGRTFVGIAAGGSEVTAAAGTGRADAPERVAELVSLLDRCSRGEPLDPRSGRTLDLALRRVPVLVAGRGDRMLRVAGAVADRVLLWAIPASDLDRTVSMVTDAAAERERAPELIWAPLVDHGSVTERSLMQVAVYASLNTRPAIRARWGLAGRQVERIRERLVAGDTAAAAALVPRDAFDDLLLTDNSPARVAGRARLLGVSSMAVPGHSAGSLAGHVEWAREVEKHLDR